MTTTDRKKQIVRWMKEGKSDDEIRAQLGPTRAKAEELKQKETSPFENSPIYGLPFGIGDNPLVANKLREGLDRAMGTLGAPAAGIAKAVESGNPLDAIIGAIENIGARSTEQKTVSEALGRPSDTLGQMAGNFGIDIATDPTTWTGAGLIKNFIQKGAKAGAKELGKAAVKGTAIAGGAALAAKDNPEGAAMAMAPLALGGSFKGAGKIPDGFYSVLEQEIENLGKQTSKSMPSIKIAQALKKRPIKADEWKDVGMDSILSERSSYTLQELLDLVKQRRPELRQGRSAIFQPYSTAKGNIDELTAYEEVITRQANPDSHGIQLEQYNSGIPEGSSNHFGEDAIGHYRTDVAKGFGKDYDKIWKERHKIGLDLIDARADLEQGTFRDRPEIEARLANRINELENKLNEFEATNSNTLFGGPKKYFVVNEVQSDVHQAGRKFGVRKPSDTARVSTIRKAERRAADPRTRPTFSQSIYDLQRKASLKQSAAKHNKDMAYHTVDGKHTDVNPKWKRIEEIIDQAKFNPTIRGGEYQLFGINAPYRADISGVKDDLLERLGAQAALLEMKPNPRAAMANTWDLFGLKSALRDAVNNGADRFGIVTGDTVDQILGEGANVGSNPGRSKFYDETLINKLQKFLRSQGINEQFSEPQTFRNQYEARFIPITEQIKQLVAKGMPLYAALMAVNIFNNQETDEAL